MISWVVLKKNSWLLHFRAPQMWFALFVTLRFLFGIFWELRFAASVLDGYTTSLKCLDYYCFFLLKRCRFNCVVILEDLITLIDVSIIFLLPIISVWVENNTTYNAKHFNDPSNCFLYNHRAVKLLHSFSWLGLINWQLSVYCHFYFFF